MRPSRLGPQIPGKEQDLDHENRDGAELARAPQLTSRAAPPFRASPGASPLPRSPRAPVSSPRIWPSRITRMRSTSASTSGKSLDDDQARHAGRRALANQIVDLELRAHVHALRRLVEQQHARVGRQPFGGHDFLLVAAARACRAASAIDRRADREARTIDSARRAFRARVDRADAPLRRRRQRDVVPDRQIEVQAQPLPILGDERQAGARRVARRRERDIGCPSMRDAAAVGAARGRRAFPATRCGPIRPDRRAPTISPGRTVRTKSAKPGRTRQVLDGQRGAASGRAAGRSTRAGGSRPTIARTIASGVVVARSNVPTNAPSRSTVMRSHRRNTSGSRCDTNSSVTPRASSSCRMRNRCSTSASVSDVVGSSSTSTRQSNASARATCTSCATAADACSIGMSGSIGRCRSSEQRARAVAHRAFVEPAARVA